jgi:class 3 adenylate cyclase
MPNPDPNLKPAAHLSANCHGHVLVVDDEEQNRMLLRDPLEARGYEVSEAVDGDEALRKVRAHPPDVILLDLMMPKLNGFDVCRCLKANDKTSAIPVLMVTALSDRKERLMGIEAGANDFLNKPVDLQDVILRVGNAAYAKHLYDQLKVEQEKSERLLLNILPQPIAERMKNGEVNIADSIPEGTVLVADLVGFTSLSAHIGPDQIVHLLNEIFSAFDVLAYKHEVEKIKTMGDAYMAAGGVPFPRPDHAEAVAGLALDLREEMERFNREYGTSIRLRIGISTGPIIAGVIGRKKFAYDLWGDPVNLACRLESLGEPGTILVAATTYEQLQHKYRFEPGRNVKFKSCGEVIAYPLRGRV